MVLPRPFLALLSMVAMAASLGAAEPKPADAQALEVIAKAHASAAKEPKFLERVKGLHFEMKSFDPEGKLSGYIILQVVAPAKRRQMNYSADYSREITRSSNGLEGWITQRELRAGGRSELGVMRFDEVARLKDMAINDLTFYAAPDAASGTVSYKGESEINGRKVRGVQYTYRSGYNLIRHFDAQTNLLVATDYLDASGKPLRQIVEEMQWVEGLAFAKKESIHIEGKKVADVIYEKVAINPEVSDSSFAFPQR